MRTPIAHPLPILGSILVHKSDGSTVLLPASTESFSAYEIGAVREKLGLAPLDEPPTPISLGKMQRSATRESVVIRSSPGFMNCGYESVEIESKDERIVRLEQANKALERWMDATLPLVGDVMEAFKEEPEMVAFRGRILAALEKTGAGGVVVSPKGCEVVR